MPTPVDLLSLWLPSPPRIWVIGEGPYARALAQVTAAQQILTADLRAWDGIPEDVPVPRVLEKLEVVFVVLGPAHGASVALQCTDRCWSMVKRVSSQEEEHPLRIIFVPLIAEVSGLVESLAVGLACSVPDLPSHGYGVWGDPGSLLTLNKTLEDMVPSDLKALRGRRRADERRLALRDLLRQSQHGGDEARMVACRVLEVFAEHEHDLDLFCQSPAHQHGNRLRVWLRHAVTDEVTPSWQEEGRQKLSQWLALS